MISIKVQGLKEVQGYVEAMARDQLPFALAKGLTDTANLVREKEVNVMKTVFDRPTQFTLNSLQVTPAKKDSLIARVGFKTPTGMDGKQHYLEAEIEGGGRELKPFEYHLGNKDLMPGLGMKLNKYGNIPRAQLVQILAAVQMFGGDGASEKLQGKMDRLKNVKSRDIFVVMQKTGGLVPGVYLRAQNGPGIRTKGMQSGQAFQKGKKVGKFSSVIQARGVRPLLIFTAAPTYKKRFPFEETAQQAVNDNFKPLFAAAIQKALQTARG